MKGKLSASQVGAFLVFLKLLGLETEPVYIAAVAKAMQESALAVNVNSKSGVVVDIVGTGGDGQVHFI